MKLYQPTILCDGNNKDKIVQKTDKKAHLSASNTVTKLTDDQTYSDLFEQSGQYPDCNRTIHWRVTTQLGFNNDFHIGSQNVSHVYQ